MRSLALCRLALWGNGDLFGDGPHEPNALTRHRHHHLVGVFPPCHQASTAFAQAHVGFLTDVLDGCGWLLESQLHAATDFRGIPVRPGAFDQGSTGMTMARCGDGALTTPLTRGVCRGHQAHELHEVSGMIKAGEVSEFSDHGDRHRALDAASGVKGLDHRLQAPGCTRRVALVFETLEACDRLADRPHIFLEDDVQRGGGTHPCGKPPERGWAPRGPACPTPRKS